MPDQENNVFRIGDVVTLKLNPEFRAVIQHFGTPFGNGSFKIEYGSWVKKDSPNAWSSLSRLDSDNKIITLQVPVVHLKLVEESNT